MNAVEKAAEKVVAQLTGAIYALMVVGGASGDQIRELVEEAIADTERRQEAEGR